MSGAGPGRDWAQRGSRATGAARRLAAKPQKPEAGLHADCHAGARKDATRKSRRRGRQPPIPVRLGGNDAGLPPQRLLAPHAAMTSRSRSTRGRMELIEGLLPEPSNIKYLECIAMS